MHEKTTYKVDGEGRRLTIQRPGADATTLWRMTYDAAGQLRSVTDPLTHVTTYGYDVDGRRTTIEDARHHTTTFGYDERHRLRSKTYPITTGSAVHTWHYDANNNLDQEVTPNGRTLSSQYDALNRRTDLAISAKNGAPEEAATHWSYDGNGNVLSIEETRGNATLTDTRRYDHFDRLEHRVNTDASTLTYGYDDVGNRARLTDADGTTTWTYDALNRNTAVIVSGQGTTLLDYYPSGLPKTTTRPDGSSSTTTYDDAGRVESIEHSKAGNAIATLHYTYYPNGNRHEQRETNGAVTQNAEQLTTYVYDTADRLTEITEPAASGAGSRHTTYILDEVGNRTDETITLDGTPVSHSTLQYNQRDQLTQRDDPIANVHVSQTYDADGNLATQTSNGLQRVSTYDARDRLVTLAMPNAPPMRC